MKDLLIILTEKKDEAGTIRYTYDANGNVLTVTEKGAEKGAAEKVITRTYDALNRVTGYTDAAGNTIGYQYDTFGNLSGLTYPDGRTVSYIYDKNGNVRTVTDWEHRVTTYSYDQNSRLVKTERPDGSVETRTYDKIGQLLTISDVAKDGTVISDLTYTYDEAGNIVHTADGVKAARSRLVSQTTGMEYDNVNRLIRYNGKDVLYDKDGNMTYGPLDGEMAAFAYDCRNRLIQAETDSGEVTEYVYDAEDNRIGITKHAGTDAETVTSYVVDSVSGGLTQIIRSDETDTEGTTRTLYYYYGDNRLIAQEEYEDGRAAADTYMTYHFNNVGSTVAVTGESGAVKYRYAYSPYGDLIEGSYGDVAFLFNGQYGVMSDDNGLYYMRARYYNIDIKRFINQDILTGTMDSSQSLNRYAYVEGNPVSYEMMLDKINVTII